MKLIQRIRRTVILVTSGVLLTACAFSASAKCLDSSSSDLKQVLKDGEQTYNTTCAICHNPSLAAAPIPAAHNQTDWNNMVATACKGNNAAACSPAALKKADPFASSCVLLPVAIKGKNAMPPRGGKTTLSDSALQSAIIFMMSEKKK